jgi:ssDNA-binding Zn-finger/Zn-ribbon topoisomerase 1
MNTPDPMTQTECPKCGSVLSDVISTPNGRKLKRCSAGVYNPKTHKTEGCDYTLWFPFEPQELDEKCPKCGANLVLSMTKFGKKMKKCSKGGWDPEARKATGCDYVEWINGTTEELDEDCPTCGAKLVLFTTANGKRLKKCSTAGWDKEERKATGCTYVEWLK